MYTESRNPNSAKLHREVRYYTFSTPGQHWSRDAPCTCIKQHPSRDAPLTCKHRIRLFRNSRLACKLYCLHLAFSAQHWLLEIIVNSTVHRKGPQLLKSCVVFHSCPERLVGHLFHHSYWTFSSSLTCHIK